MRLETQLSTAPKEPTREYLSRLIFGYLPPKAIISLEHFVLESDRIKRIVIKDATFELMYISSLFGMFVLIPSRGAAVSQDLVMAAVALDFVGIVGTSIKLFVDVGNSIQYDNRRHALEQADVRNTAILKAIERYPGIPHKSARLLSESSYQSLQALDNSNYWSDPYVRMGINSLFYDAVALLRMQDVSANLQDWRVALRERLENSPVEQSLDRSDTWTPESVMEALKLVNQANIKAVNLFHSLELTNLLKKLPMEVPMHGLIQARSDIISIARDMRMAYKQTQEVATRLNINGSN